LHLAVFTVLAMKAEEYDVNAVERANRLNQTPAQIPLPPPINVHIATDKTIARKIR
jgi:hypothetical protein